MLVKLKEGDFKWEKINGTVSLGNFSTQQDQKKLLHSSRSGIFPPSLCVVYKFNLRGKQFLAKQIRGIE